MTKRIYLTIDIECHDIKKKNLYIDGNTKNGCCGLAHILALAEELEIPVNCFLDIPEVQAYGEAYIKEIIALIEKHHQHVYLHLHPNYITGQHEKSFLWQYQDEEKKRIVAEGCELYRRYVKHQVDYFRIGRYGADEGLYDALASATGDVCDLSYCTNCNKMCHLPYEEVRTHNKAVPYKGHIVLPNTRYIGLKTGKRDVCINLDTSDSTYNEFTRVLKATRLNQLVFTMHSWNFIRKYFFLNRFAALDRYEEKKFRKMILFAKEQGFQFCDLRTTPPRVSKEENDELIDLCAGVRDLPFMIMNNFTRYRRIGRLNMKYFSIYMAFYMLCLAAVAWLFLH